MKIAIIGSGIAGNTAAYHLHQQGHDITVYEAASHIGGHTHTHSVIHEGERFAVDTGFIVFNDRTYPNFIGLLEKLNVPWQDSDMSFSVRCEKSGLEYNGSTLNSLFAQRRNLVRPKFYQMVADILRFNRSATELLAAENEIPLGQYLSEQKYSPQFIEYYIIPMGAAIWSTDAEQMLAFPARFFVRFFHHHGMLSINDRPVWRVIRGGSARYVEALTRDFAHRIRLNSPVMAVRRTQDAVWVSAEAAGEEAYDWVVFACHSDQALGMLQDPSQNETEILSALPFQDNSVILHTDQSLLPKRKLAWAAWNYHVTAQATSHVTVTYNMNILQGLQSHTPLLVTLNRDDLITPSRIIKKLRYQHPIFTLKGVAAQARHHEISGHRRTSYCGAYWFNGFHEDGVRSGMRVAEEISANTQPKMPSGAVS